MAQATDLVIRRGNNLKIEGTIVDQDGNPVSLSGAAVTWRVFPYPNAPHTSAVLSVVATITDAAGGLYEVSLTAAASAGLMGSAYRYETEVVTGAGEVYDCAYGQLAVEGHA